MADELMPVGKAYAYDLLQCWTAFREVANQFRINYCMNKIDEKLYSNYCSLLAGWWIELKPNIENRKESQFTQLTAKFKEYEKYAKDPRLLMKEPNKAVELEILVREAIDKLKITDFEGVKI